MSKSYWSFIPPSKKIVYSCQIEEVNVTALVRCPSCGRNVLVDSDIEERKCLSDSCSDVRFKLDFSVSVFTGVKTGPVAEGGI